MHVMAACEKRRSGLAPSTTQGPGTKTESSIFGMPNQQIPPGSFHTGLWSCGRGCLRAGVLWKGGDRPSAGPLTTYLAINKTKKKKLKDLASFIAPSCGSGSPLALTMRSLYAKE